MRSDRHKKKNHRLAKFLLKLLAFILFLAACFVAALTVFEYSPEPSEIISIAGTSSAHPNAGETIKILSWNIGYGALGDNASFFLDGGKDVITSEEERVNANLDAIASYLDSERADITLLQEVDKSSKRSYGINESHYILENTEGAYTATFAINYKVFYVPYPIPPLGKVNAGLLTTSVYDINFSRRASLPNPFSWPMRIVNLDRCLMIDRISINGSNKDLVVINLHLEAYADSEGNAEQIKAMMEVLEEEYAKGNYVIAGGDFNQTFSSVDLSKYPKQGKRNWEASIVDVTTFGSNWTALMDSSVPSCRLLNKPYVDADKDTFQYYVIDGFIVSNNLKIESLHTKQLNFVNSDHNPVILEVTIPFEEIVDEESGEDGDDESSNG
ncbi:MAG: endonuclease [Firmicutes bacterium]|nr:endonuclease [Bacillota bacterium]